MDADSSAAFVVLLGAARFLSDPAAIVVDDPLSSSTESRSVTNHSRPLIFPAFTRAFVILSYTEWLQTQKEKTSDEGIAHRKAGKRQASGRQTGKKSKTEREREREREGDELSL